MRISPAVVGIQDTSVAHFLGCALYLRISKIETLGQICFVFRVRKPRISPELFMRRTRSAMARAASNVVRRTISLMEGTNAELMLRRRSPMPNRGRKQRGRPAISPHKVTGLSRSQHALMM